MLISTGRAVTALGQVNIIDENWLEIGKEVLSDVVGYNGILNLIHFTESMDLEHNQHRSGFSNVIAYKDRTYGDNMTGRSISPKQYLNDYFP